MPAPLASPALALALALALAALAPLAMAANVCGIDLRAAVKGRQAVHKAMVETMDLCLTFQNDVYQRFSGYASKYQMGILCEHAVGALTALQRLAMEAALPPGAAGEGAGREAPGTDLAALAAVAAARVRGLDAEFALVYRNFNAADDGSLPLAVSEHLGMISYNLVQAQDWVQQGSCVNWPELAETLSAAMSRVVKVGVGPLVESVTYNLQVLNVSDLPRFLSLFGNFPAAIPVEVRRRGLAEGRENMCQDFAAIYHAQHVFDPIADPHNWRSRDVSGILFPRPSLQKLLFTISKAVPLSYNFIAVVARSQVGTQELTSEYKQMFEATGGLSAPSSDALASSISTEPSCSGIGLSYSPAHCLFDLGWGSMMFSLSTEHPYDGVLSVSEMSLKGKGARPKPFVQPVANGTASLDELIDQVDSVYKSLNTPSPDLFFLSPLVGNCLTMRKLGPSRRDSGNEPGGFAIPQLTPKLVFVPVNPLVAPPWELAPNFSEWHALWLERRRNNEDADGVNDEAKWWYAQCSLSSAAGVLAEQGYVLLHLEHNFAVFVLRGLWSAIAPLLQAMAPDASAAGAQQSPIGSKTVSLYDHWVTGWFCSPVAPTLFGLEWGAGVDLGALHDRQTPAEIQRRRLCEFTRVHQLPLAVSAAPQVCEAGAGRPPQAWRSWELQDPTEERGKAYLLEEAGRGRCLSQLGFCECFPPYRGRFCEHPQLGTKDAGRPYRAVLHYLVGDCERLLADFVRTLPLLWERFNERFDYPVVVFHDGLAPQSRQRILEASSNRIWFAFVDDYTSVPAYLKGRLEMDLGGYSLGYRGMCRFRSGPMFAQPVMRGFDYAWTLDTDGYFPAQIRSDPFEQMWRQGSIYAYSHVSRDQAAAVVHFWEFCRLYIESKGIDPKGTKIMRRITDALVLRDTFWHEWNRVLFMNDIEITKLTWFRGEQYQDFFRFLDSVGGFWLYRWGDHAVRTIAIALFLDPELLMRMGVPYGHQNTCRCGDERPHEVCVRATPSDWWQCVPQDAGPSAGPGAMAASGDVGTVHDSLMFGGT